MGQNASKEAGNPVGQRVGQSESRQPAFRMPARYEPLALLGRGGGGEVWSVRDRIAGKVVALKALAEDAGNGEIMSLVREAVTLSGLEGLGVPLVLAFGRLPGSTRRFLVRELVDGTSLEEVLAGDRTSWLVPLATAADQLTVLHRAGLLHGDIKPANIIVSPSDASGTLVDLGLATPFREGGARARGLTPKFAAPELFAGEPLTVRAEVYALGATLVEALGRRGKELDGATFRALAAVAERATESAPDDRYPSVDELGSALRSAARLETKPHSGGAAWPVVGIDGAAQELVADAALLGPGEGLAIEGPPRSGRTAFARRLAWSLGVSGTPVASIEPARGAPGGLGASSEIVAAELAAWSESSTPLSEVVIVVDDLEDLDEAARLHIRNAAAGGARVIAVAREDALQQIVPGGTRSFVVPPLDEASATELVKRAVPSLPDRLVRHLLQRTVRRPGALRAFVRRLGDRVVTSTEEIDEVLEARDEADETGERGRIEVIAELARALDTGRFDLAATNLAELGEGENGEESVLLAVARSRIALARGDADESARALDAVARSASESKSQRVWQIARARTYMRAGDSKEAARLAERAAGPAGARDGAITADALAVHGLALAFLGDDDAGRRALEEGAALARQAGDPRTEAIALVSLAIAHQRAARPKEARDAYEAALALAERARDAWTLATTRLNLGGLCKGDGDLAQAIVHLEGAIDMGQRAGSLIVVQQALFNLANLDLHLGRYARAAASIDRLAQQASALPPAARAQLIGLEAEHAARTGDLARATERYRRSAEAYEAIERPLDGAEARLEAILTRLSAASPDAFALGRELDELRGRLGDFGEHEALAQIVRGSIALACGDEAAARDALDQAHDRATATGQREWAWRALEARARLAQSQGSSALAKRDIEAALALLEETAAKLPRDLREVFWNDPRRRALQRAHGGTAAGSIAWSGTLRGILGETTGGATMNAPRNATVTSMGTPMPSEDRLMRIFEITRDLARERDLDRLLQHVTDHAIGLVGAERGLVVLVDETGAVVPHTARDGKGDESHQTFSRSVAERVIREGEPVIVGSARDDERLAQAVSVHQLMIQSIACVPIRGAPPAASTIGALYLETRIRPGVRFREELPTLAAFADQAAIAIESARLLDENKRRAVELERMNAELEAAKAKLAERLDVKTEQLATVRRDLKQARAELRGHFGYGGLVGTSAAMRKVYALIERLKDTDVPILVTGESGTGKEVIAKAIHASGGRAKQPFLGVNCGAIPANLLESELFGHVRGAFTGADRDRKGLFREAENGTILLDEIGELPTKMQAGLLRVLQEKTVRPVGGTKEEPCAARVVAATNRDLAQMVAEGTFREDLFYRLHVVELKIPALRERAEDIPALIDHFLGLFASRHKRERKTVERSAVRRLQSYDWPGNVRQLEHVLLNAWLLAEDDEIHAEDLDLPTPSARAVAIPSQVVASVVPSSAQPSAARSKDDFKTDEKEKILAALQRSNWNRVQAAKTLGIPRRTFYRRLKDYGIV